MKPSSATAFFRGANTALHNELRQTSLQQESLQAAYSEDKLERLVSTMSFQQLSLQQDSLQAAYSERELDQTASTRSFGQRSLQQNSLQAAYSIGGFQTPSLTVTSLSFQDQLTATSLDELERTALETELARLKRRQRSSSSLSRTSFPIILVILMIAAFLSKSIFKSFRDRELERMRSFKRFLLIGHSSL